MATTRDHPLITSVRTFLVAPDPRKSEADKPGHWLYYQEISNPMSKYAKYKDRRESWGVDVLKDFVVEIEASDGTVGFAIGHVSLSLQLWFGEELLTIRV
jgi:L-rhamnonate dehydratase